jgi:hypothetical protein
MSSATRLLERTIAAGARPENAVHRMKIATSATIGLLVLAISAGRAMSATSISACGKVITASGTYVLQKNLVSQSNKDCITIGTGAVIIDMQGYSISGKGAAIGNGIAILPGEGPFAITIRNGVISGCDANVAVRQAQGVLIDRVTSISGINEGISIGQGSSVVRSTVVDNSGDGIFLNCPSSVIDSTVIGNGTGGNGFSNIAINSGSGCNFFNNLAP